MVSRDPPTVTVRTIQELGDKARRSARRGKSGGRHQPKKGGRFSKVIVVEGRRRDGGRGLEPGAGRAKTTGGSPGLEPGADQAKTTVGASQAKATFTGQAKTFGRNPG